MEKLEEIRKIYEELKTVQMVKKRECLFRRKSFLQLEKYKCLLHNGKTIFREKILKNQNIEIVPIDEKLFEGASLLPSKIKGTIVIAPNELYEGFFIAKLRKNRN